MKLIRAQITKFKSIDDSGEVSIDPALTALVGQNEAGKTAFLKALYKAEPVEGARGHDITEDYPRKGLNEYRARHEKQPEPVAVLTYALDPVELEWINNEVACEYIRELTFSVTNKYGGSRVVSLHTMQKPLVGAYLRSSGLTAEVRSKADKATSIDALITLLEAIDLNAEGTAFLDSLKRQFPEPGASGWTRVDYWIWEKVIDPYLPKFLYFDDYYLLPGKVNLATLRTRVSQKTTKPEDDVVLALLRMAGVKLSDLLESASYEEVKAKLEALSNSITDRVFEYWTQNQELDVEFDIRADSNDDAPFDNGSNLYIRIRNRRHRVTVPFSQRSKGFIWFFSFLVWFDSVRKQIDSEADLILLLDEPGLSLHALAQADLLRYMDKIAEKHQILYTTHSPFMVHSDRLHQVRLVEDRRTEGTRVTENVSGSDPKTVFPLQAALGYTIAQNLFISRRNLLVEGPADLVYLKFFSSALDERGRSTLRDDITVVPVGGLDKLATFVALLGANELEIVVLHDHAGKPDLRLQSLVRDKLIQERLVLNYGGFRTGTRQVTLPPTDVEDLFTPSLYLKVFNATFRKQLAGRELKEADLPAGDRIVDRVGRYLAKAGIQLRPSGGFNHYAVANYLASHPVKPDSATLGAFEQLFVAINRLFTTT